MISRGEVGLIVTAMGTASGTSGRPEVALMVAAVLLATLLTPMVLRATFNLESSLDVAPAHGTSAPALGSIQRTSQ